MSEEQLKAFIAKVQADASLQEKLNQQGADVVAIAKSSGFIVTQEDLKAYESRDLSDVDLEEVAGGAYCGWGAVGMMTIAVSERRCSNHTCNHESGYC